MVRSEDTRQSLETDTVVTPTRWVSGSPANVYVVLGTAVHTRFTLQNALFQGGTDAGFIYICRCKRQLTEHHDISTGNARHQHRPCFRRCVLSLLWWFPVRRPADAPPGPWLAVPLLGHLLLMMKKDPREQFAAWRRQYGDVFSLYLGSQLVVVLNGYKVIKDALVKNPNAFSDRLHTYINDLITDSRGKLKSSVVDTSGPVWKAQRKVAIEILRELGMGKNVLAAKIEEEVKEYIRVISESQGQPLDLAHLTQASVSNNMCSIVLGKRFDG
ncbi:hypothetical protein C0Q70_11700 [Pomacea canaliculata]|uniref:Uncharacterized protein n=1 Tax=Pomacea canaliculata TaxID=400727 RepID=A0A2T7P6T1_POMCA|nr:hypothetical protein C0Q70_11700 [Pomacea canaliculata]